MIGNFGGDLVLVDNCFIQNNVTIAPVINQNSTSLTVSSNYGELTNAQGPPYVCEFLANVEKGEVGTSEFEDLSFSCVNFDSDVCMSTTAPVKEEVTGTECLTSLNDVYFGERDVVDSNVLRTYILCPNTTFDLGNMFGDDGLALDGDNPIIIGRPNVHVFCGEDGRSENNCTLKGGRIQLAIFDEFEVGVVPATNALVQGLTFVGATSVNVLANFYADVTFRDCIFEVSWIEAFLRVRSGSTWFALFLTFFTRSHERLVWLRLGK